MTGHDADKANRSAQFRGGPNFHPVFESFLSCTEFPQEHEALVRVARERLSPDMITRLERMPRCTYNTVEEFRKAFVEDIENYGVVEHPDQGEEPEETRTTS